MSNMSQRIWWQVYPLGFCGSPVRPDDDTQRVMVPRLARLENWLDYMLGMGCDGLLLGPIFDSDTHGYDTTDFYRIDPRLGDDSTFDKLVSACRKRGVAVMLDGVFNHVGLAFPEFQAERKRAQAELDASQPLSHRGDDMFTFKVGENGKLDYEKFEGHAILPAFNHDSPRVAELVVDVMEHWMRRGVDAWRLDASTTVPAAFWAKVLPRVHRDFPRAWFMGEAIQGDYPKIVKDSTMDTVTQYELWKAIWSSLKDGNFYELDWCLKRHNGFLAAFTPQTFIGNHDVTRIASVIDPPRLALAATILFTLGGTPSVYYGDERAMTGLKTDGVGGDDAVRPEYPETPKGLNETGKWMYELTGRLAALRRSRPWLLHATSTPTLVDNRRYSYDVTGHGVDAAADDNGQAPSLHVDMDLDPQPYADIYEDGRLLLHVEHHEGE